MAAATGNLGGLVLPLAPPALRDAALSRLAELAGTQGYPGGNPVSIERRNLAQLTAEPYVVCPKTDGVRAMLLCTVVGETMLVALITRALEVFIPRFDAVNRAAFQGTAFDVEVVLNRSTNTFDVLVFDAVAACGVPVASHELSDRLMAIEATLEAWEPTPHDDTRVVAKAFYGNAADLERGEASSPYASDGLILTPSRRGNTFGRNVHLFKFKTHHTIDFLVLDDGVGLAVYDPSAAMPSKHRAVGRLERPSFAGAIIECSPANLQAGVWSAVMVRTDKRRANDMVTYSKTLINIQENIGVQEIMRCFAR